MKILEQVERLLNMGLTPDEYKPVSTQFLYNQVSWGYENLGVSGGYDFGLEKFPKIHSELQPLQIEEFLKTLELTEAGLTLSELHKTKFSLVSYGTLWITAILWTTVFSPVHFRIPGVDVLLEEKTKVKTKPPKQLCIRRIPKDPAWFWYIPGIPWVSWSWAICDYKERNPVVQRLTLRP